MTLVWSYGGGTQSAAIAVLILQGKLPRPDCIVMADTDREVTETWQYLERIVRPAGFDVQIVPHDYAYWDLYNSNALLIPAFTRQHGPVGKMPTFCSNEWKRRPIQRYLKGLGIDDCDVWLGMSTDEMERMKFNDLKWYRHIYPLIEIIPTSRHQCISLVEVYGWPTPPKSRCWMCPNMSPRAWKDLRDKYPDDFNMAVELERYIRRSDGDIYLHELGIPLDKAIEESDRQSDMFDGCDSGYCWT
jgi:hypothetical protein